MVTEIVRCACLQANLKNVAYLVDLFYVYEANVVTEIPKTAND